MIEFCDTYVMLAMTAKYISNKSMAPLAWWKNGDHDFFFFFFPVYKRLSSTEGSTNIMSMSILYGRFISVT